MKNISRLQSALKRQGILVERRHGAYHLSNQHAQASVLLPEALPLEEKAVDQLLAFASVRSPDAHHGVCKACATPDFHPGSVAPVGTIVATDAEFVIPAAIGTDINCGMRLLTTGLKQAAVEARKPELLRGLTRVLLENGRNVPVPGRAFRALFDDGPQAFIERLSSEGLWARADRDQLQAELAQCVSLADFGGAARYAPEGMVGSRETIRDPGLGTPGGGNHFVELQIVDEILDRHAAYAAGLVKGEVVVMIHTGSRDVGFHVGSRWMDRARAAWGPEASGQQALRVGRRTGGRVPDRHGHGGPICLGQPHGAGRDGQAGNGGRRRRPARPPGGRRAAQRGAARAG